MPYCWDDIGCTNDQLSKMSKTWGSVHLPHVEPVEQLCTRPIMNLGHFPRNLIKKGCRRDDDSPPEGALLTGPLLQLNPLAEILLHKNPSVVGRRSPATNGSLVLMPNGRLSLVTIGCEDQ